eukprot:c1237_g1_i1.p1 GENE.c1237_g1_i1~~c1237_g1_i1.p1  ORF type:complete len:287 (+),score=73.22 c1237_g1_i1:48-863(+)
MATPISNSKDVKSVIDMQKKVFYRTEDESGGAKCLRSMMCGCCLPRYSITTEAVRVQRWKGCTQEIDSIDVDSIADLSLSESCGIGYCLYGKGSILLYVHENGKDSTATLHYIEKAEEVFREFSSHVHKVNNMKMGIKRPDLKDVPHLIYDSKGDGFCVKVYRSLLCCSCCFFPRTVVTKEHITTARWTLLGKKTTSQFDLDQVTDLTLSSGCLEGCCCGTGTIIVTGKDKDQDGVRIRFVGDAQKVFKKMDDYDKVLNNRGRVLGDTMTR